MKEEKDLPSATIMEGKAIGSKLPFTASVPGRNSAGERPRPTETKINIEGLNFYYGRAQALHNITLEIPSKQITAFIGPSGCGKSTLLRTINRMNDLIPGTRVEGTVAYHDEDIYASYLDPVE